MKTLLCLLLCLPALAVAGPDVARAPAAEQVPASAPAAPVRTLETIEALRPPVDWTPDPFARRSGHFDGRFGRGPTPEEIALQHGGYLMYGISKALSKGGSWLNRVTGGPAQIQHANARDVPLDDEQIARAARWAAQQPAAVPDQGD
ncbi:MAG: hypothetical protein ACI4NW_09910 [Stenotrophomonas sp.]